MAPWAAPRAEDWQPPADAPAPAPSANLVQPGLLLPEPVLSESVLSESALSESALSESALSEPVLSESAVPEPPPESEWVPPTWEDVVRNHSARVYRLAYRLTGNPYDAEDLTQDVFVRVFRSLHRFQPGTFEGWLHRITTNLFLDGARRRQKIRFDGLADNAADRLASRTPAPAEQVEDAGLDHDVAAALAALAPEFRAAVVLCDIEELTYEEIAEALDVKIGTVRSRIHRGRAQLREALAHRRPTADHSRYLGAEVEGAAASSVAGFDPRGALAGIT